MTFRLRGERRRLKKEVGEKSMTQQHFKDQCDVNFIMEKYQKTGLLDHVRQYGGDYGDFTDAPDYHTALNKMLEAQEMFLTVPSRIRELFHNDPGEFLEFVANPENEAEMRELGLLPKKVPVAEATASEPPSPEGRNSLNSGGPEGSKSKEGKVRAEPERSS